MVLDLTQLPGVGGMDTTHLVALAAALGWASGVRLYAVVLITGLVGFAGWVQLPPGLALLQNPLVLGAAGIMTAMEFLADKVPWIDSIWDSVHTLIRIPAGAMLAAGVFGGIDAPAWQMVAALAGGTLAATAHMTKATTRAAVNASPEPFTNVGLSLLGDAAVPTMLWLAFQHPVAFFIVLAIVLVLSVALIVMLFKVVKRVLAGWQARLGVT